MRVLLLAAGFLLLGTGFLIGLVPASFTDTGDTTYTCGSPWGRDHSGEQSARTSQAIANAMIGAPVYAVDYEAECDNAIGSRGVVGGVFAGFGALTLLAVGVVVAMRQQQPPTPPEDTATAAG